MEEGEEKEEKKKEEYLVDLLGALLEARRGLAQLLHVATRRVQLERQHRLCVLLDAELLVHVFHRRLEELHPLTTRNARAIRGSVCTVTCYSDVRDSHQRLRM